MRGTVTKKRDRWYICYYVGKDSNGKWKQKWEGSWTTKREAERVLRSRIEEIENTFERKAADCSVEAFLAHWMETYCKTRLAANTVRGYEVNIHKHIVPGIGKIPLNRLQPKDVQKLYTDLANAGLSGTSIRYVHNNLHRALGYAVKSLLIPRNPADFVEAPRIDRYEATTLTPEQVVNLLQACADKEIYLPVLLAVSLGLRRGEVLGLQWNDVDMQHHTLTIRRSANFSKDGMALASPKTKNSRRTLLIPEHLQVVLLNAKTTQQGLSQAIGESYNPLNLVCCRADGSVYTASVLQHQFRELLEVCGLPHIRFHDLRHTNATLMLRNAVPAKIVSSMLGHSSIGITMDTYSHVITEMQEGATTVMDDLLKELC